LTTFAAVVIVLVDVAEGQGVEMLAEQFDPLVTTARRVAGVGEFAVCWQGERHRVRLVDGDTTALP
jgi:hypothetical protein